MNINWSLLPNHYIENMYYELTNLTLSNGGLKLTERFGMKEWTSPEDGGSSDADNRKAVFEATCRLTESCLLLAIDANTYLVCFACGMYPIYSVDLSALYISRYVPSDPNKVINLSSDFKSSFSITSHSTTSEGTAARCLHNLPVLSVYKWHEHKAYLMLSMHRDVEELDRLVSGIAKKWMDCTRVITAKLSLMRSALSAYELPYSPIEFLFTVSLLGLWHPVAQSTFANNWNEQGLQRMRSTVESASKDILQTIHMQIDPVLTNLLLKCYELFGMVETEMSSQKAGRSSVIHVTECSTTQILQKLNELASFIAWIENVMLKLDEMSFEATLATRSMKLFFEFVKANMMVATPPAAPKEGANAPVPPSIANPAYSILFDPRIPRAAEGVGVNAFGEIVTGTHLYAYFLDKPLNEDVIRYRRRGGEGLVAADTTQLPLPYLRNRHELMEAFIARQQGIANILNVVKPKDMGGEPVGNGPSYRIAISALDDESLLKMSLTTVIKHAKSSFQSVFFNHGFEPNKLLSSSCSMTPLNYCSQLDIMLSPSRRKVYAVDTVTMNDIVIPFVDEGETRGGQSCGRKCNVQLFAFMLNNLIDNSSEIALVYKRESSVGTSTDCADNDTRGGCEWYGSLVTICNTPDNYSLHLADDFKLYSSCPSSDGNSSSKCSILAILNKKSHTQNDAPTVTSPCVIKVNLLQSVADDLMDEEGEGDDVDHQSDASSGVDKVHIRFKKLNTVRTNYSEEENYGSVDVEFGRLLITDAALDLFPKYSVSSQYRILHELKCNPQSTKLELQSSGARGMVSIYQRKMKDQHGSIEVSHGDGMLLVIDLEDCEEDEDGLENDESERKSNSMMDEDVADD